MMVELNERVNESREGVEQNVFINPREEQPQHPQQVTVPAGIRPGMQFAVDVEGQRMVVTCPANVQPGMNLQMLRPETQHSSPNLPIGGGDGAIMIDHESDCWYREAIVDLLSIGQLAGHLASSEDANARGLVERHIQTLVVKTTRNLGAQRSREDRRRDRAYVNEVGSATDQARERCMELLSAIAAISQVEPQPPGPPLGVQMHLPAGPAPPVDPAPAGPAILPQGIAQFLAGAVEDFSSSDDDESSAGSLQLTNFVASMETVKKNGSLVHNEDYFGFMEETRSNNNAHNLLARVEQKCGTALEDSPTDTILVVGKCDPMSRFIQQFHRLLANEIGLADLEEKISQLAKTLNPHMKVIAAVKGVALDDAKAAVEKRHRHASLDMPVSSLMEIMDPEDADASESSSKEPTDLQRAAMNAAQEYGGGAWKDLATLTAYGQVFLAWTSSLVVFIRVMRQVSYQKFLEFLSAPTAKKVKKLMKHFEAPRSLDLSDDSTTMADVYENILVPSMHPGESDETREKADGLLAMMKFLGHNQFAEFWKVAGVMSLTKTFTDYSEDSIRELLAEFKETYYSESDDRRRISSRTATYPLTAKRVASALALHSMSDEDAYWFPFALTCCPPTMYNHSPLAFMLDSRLLGKVTDEAYAKKILTQKKGGVRAVFASMKRALIGFNKLHVYIDVTADVRNGTSDAHQALAAALSLPPPSE